MPKPILRNQSGVIFLTLAVMLLLVLIISIALTAKRAHDRQQLIKHAKTLPTTK